MWPFATLMSWRRRRRWQKSSFSEFRPKGPSGVRKGGKKISPFPLSQRYPSVLFFGWESKVLPPQRGRGRRHFIRPTDRRASPIYQLTLARNWIGRAPARPDCGIPALFLTKVFQIILIRQSPFVFFFFSEPWLRTSAR